MTVTGGRAALDVARLRREAVATADRVFEALCEEVEASLGARGPVDVLGLPLAEADPEPVPVRLVARAGGTASAPLWVHTTGPVGAGGLTLAATALASADGARIAAERVRLSPPQVDVTAPGPAEVWVTVAVPPGAAAGVYTGLVEPRGLPAAEGLAVRLLVEP